MNENFLTSKSILNSPIYILHVEDNENFQKLVDIYFENENITIIQANDGEQGLKKYKNNIDKIDCILSDYNMPKMNGLEFLKCVREINSTIPFITLTGQGSEKIASEFIKYNVDDYIKKELVYNSNELLSKRVRNVISKYDTQQKLRENEIIINKIINKIDDYIFLLDKNGKIIKSNELGEQFCINKMGDYNNIYLKQLFDNNKQIDLSIREVLKGNKTKVYIDTIYNNSKQIFVLKNTLLEEDSNKILCIVKNISDYKKTEEELRNKNERLDAFMKIITHDIRNPLSIAKGNLELYMDENNNNNSEKLNTTLKSIERIENISQEVLDIIKYNEEVTLKEVNINDIAYECWNNVKKPGYNLEISSDFKIELNYNLGKRLFENLFKNTINHAGKNVTITIGKLEDGFYVEDDGKGIKKIYRKNIFNSNYTTSESGEGLGLMIVKKICETHNWDIEVLESNYGGVRFEIRTN